MAAKGSSLAPTRSSLRVFTAALGSAACEWLLIFLLLLDGMFAYLLTEFSRYCRLQVPCIFCSRLDHVLRNEKPGYYYKDLICTSHQAEMSRLMFCHAHGKLADGRALCDDCLTSFSTVLSPNSDMQRVVMGKLGFDLGSTGSPSLFTSKDLLPGAVATKLCSCCRKPWRSRQGADRTLRLKSPSSAFSKPNVPLAPHRFSRQESLRKIREKYSGSLTPCRLGNAGYASLSHVGYSELKFNSDSESEFQYSDDDDDDEHQMNEPPKEEQSQTLNATDEMDQPSARSWQDQGEGEVVKDENRVRIPAIPELIPLDILPPRNLEDVPHVLKIEIKEQNDPSVLSTDSRVLTELVALVDTPSASRDHFGASEMNGPDDIATDDLNNKQTEALKQVVDKGAAVTQGVQVAPDVLSTYIIPLQHNETPKAIINASEPEVQHGSDQSKMAIGSSSRGIQTPPESVSKERSQHDSNLESLDGNVSEIEGESVDDRLKRQIEHDRILISTLTKELDEERNASTIAANQAMAMITRLQEEKAALHMEALQYLRMMEEQAEYDGEELEKTNDLLAEREKELQDLEAELDYFRMKYPEEEEEEDIEIKTSRDNYSNMIGGEGTTSSSYAEHNINGIDKVGVFTKPSWPDIEEEKSFIFQRLKCLERKLRKVSQTAASPYMSDSEYSEEITADRGVVGTGEFAVGNNGNHNEDLSKDQNFAGSLARNEQRAPNPHHETADLATLKNEISDLNERLEALETDWSFLEHALNSLESGKEGLQFVQEIAHRLHELRKIGLRSSRSYQPVPC